MFIFFNIYLKTKNSIEKKIKELEQMGVKGILEADSNLIKKIWDPEFMVNTPRNNIAENRDAVFQNQKAGLINYKSFERIIEKMQIQKDIVITMGYEIYIPSTDLQEARAGEIVKRRFTNIWKKQGGSWMQIARHASVICQ